MSPKQIEGANKLARDSLSKLREVLTSLEGLDPETRESRLRDSLRPLDETWRDAVARVLDRSQLRRFRQIELQRRGLHALSEEIIQKAVNLSEIQTEVVISVISEYKAEIRRIATSRGELTDKPTSDLTHAAQAEAQLRLNAVLTDTQHQAWRKLLGEPFRRQEQRK